MRFSEFWEAMDAEFGAGYSRSVAKEQHIAALDGLSPAQALDAGFAAREVWRAVCDHMGVPVERRFGPDRGAQRPNS